MTTTSTFADSIAAAAAATALQIISGGREASVRRGEMERSVPAIKVMAPHEREERDRERGTERNYNGPMTRHFSWLESHTSPHASTLEGIAATSSDPPAKCANL